MGARKNLGEVNTPATLVVFAQGMLSNEHVRDLSENLSSEVKCSLPRHIAWMTLKTLPGGSQAWETQHRNKSRMGRSQEKKILWRGFTRILSANDIGVCHDKDKDQTPFIFTNHPSLN